MKEFHGFFIKIGKYEHMKSLQTEGIVHCKPIQYFASLKDEQFRGDDLETVTDLRYSEKVKVHFLPIGEPSNRELITFDNTDVLIKSQIIGHCGNLFCLYALNMLDFPLHQPVDFSLDCDLGTHALVIQSNEFFEKIESLLEGMEIDYEMGFVEYKDFSKFTGSKTFFEKDIKFTPQNEYRIWIGYRREEDLNITIGSIEDISYLLPIEELRNKVLIRDDGALKVTFLPPAGRDL